MTPLVTKVTEEIIYTISSSLQKREEVVFAYLFGSFIDLEMPAFRCSVIKLEYSRG